MTTDYDRSVVVPVRVPSRALLSSWSAHDWRGGDGVGHPTKDAKEVWHVTRDITLGKNVPGYP